MVKRILFFLLYHDLLATMFLYWESYYKLQRKINLSPNSFDYSYFILNFAYFPGTDEASIHAENFPAQVILTLALGGYREPSVLEENLRLFSCCGSGSASVCVA